MPLSMEAEHFLLADDALMAIDWVRSKNDVTLGARLVCGAYPIFIGRGVIDRGREYCASARARPLSCLRRPHLSRIRRRSLLAPARGREESSTTPVSGGSPEAPMFGIATTWQGFDPTV